MPLQFDFRLPEIKPGGTVFEITINQLLLRHNYANLLGDQTIFPIMKKVTAFCLAVFVSLIVAQVSFAEVGRLKLSNDVKTSFEAYKFNPNYNYYFVNQENNPCAVVGIGKDYAVHDLLWSKVSSGSDQFKNVIELVKRFPMSSSPAFGARILDSKGNSIGEYYSTAAAGVTLNKEMKSIMLMIFMTGSHHNSSCQSVAKCPIWYDSVFNQCQIRSWQLHFIV